VELEKEHQEEPHLMNDSLLLPFFFLLIKVNKEGSEKEEVILFQLKEDKEKMENKNLFLED